MNTQFICKYNDEDGFCLCARSVNECACQAIVDTGSRIAKCARCFEWLTEIEWLTGEHAVLPHSFHGPHP